MIGDEPFDVIVNETWNGFLWLLPHLPDSLVSIFTPYGGALPQVAWRLPHPDLPDPLGCVLETLGAGRTGTVERVLGLFLLVLDQFLVVALSEEFFYRGFMQQRLKVVWPEGPVWLGVHLGKGFWLTQALFALGHLAEFHPWRLAVFFPAILFGALRERSGAIAAGAIFHALCNLTIFTLEASAFGR